MTTPTGRYRLLKLPFDIKSGPEMYCKAMNEMLGGVDLAYAIMGNIQIAGCDVFHHGSVLETVLHCADS